MQTYKYLKAEPFKCKNKDPTFLRRVKEDICAQSIDEGKLCSLTEQFMVSENKWKPEARLMNNAEFRKFKGRIRRDFLPDKIVIRDPVKNVTHKIEAKELRENFIKEISSNLFEGIIEMIEENFVTERD